MQDTAKNPIVLEACSVEGRLDNLRMLSEQLETCQKSLSEYLDTKRCAFPRSVNIKIPLAHLCVVCRTTSGFQLTGL